MAQEPRVGQVMSQALYVSDWRKSVSLFLVQQSLHSWPYLRTYLSFSWQAMTQSIQHTCSASVCVHPAHSSPQPIPYATISNLMIVFWIIFLRTEPVVLLHLPLQASFPASPPAQRNDLSSLKRLPSLVALSQFRHLFLEQLAVTLPSP